MLKEQHSLQKHIDTDFDIVCLELDLTVHTGTRATDAAAWPIWRN